MSKKWRLTYKGIFIWFLWTFKFSGEVVAWPVAIILAITVVFSRLYAIGLFIDWVRDLAVLIKRRVSDE